MELNRLLVIVTNRAQTNLTGTTYHTELTESISPDISPSALITMSPLTIPVMTQVRNSLWAATKGINAAERRKEALRFMMLRAWSFYFVAW